MKLIADKKVRKLISKKLKEVRDFHKDFAKSVVISRLDELEHILISQQKRAAKKIKNEFSELLSIANTCILLFGIIGYILAEEGKEIFPKDWLSQDAKPNPNDLIGRCFILLSNHSIGTIKLCESGLDSSARALLRVQAEFCLLLLVVSSDKEKLKIYHQAQSAKDANTTWYKFFKMKKLNSELEKIEKIIHKDENLNFTTRMRKEQYEFYSQSIHSSFLSSFCGSQAIPFHDHSLFCSAIYGCASAASALPLRDLCFNLIYTYQTFFKIINKIHGYKIPTSGDYLPLLQAMQVTMGDFIKIVFKYDNYLKR